MRWASFLLLFAAASASCVVEDRPVVPDLDGAVEAGECILCPTDRPVCFEDACVQCTEDEDDYCEERDQRCDADAMECVDCLQNADCRSATASRCDVDEGECLPCTRDDECDGVDGLAASNNACAEGECVECTPETESTTCPGGFACDPATRTCTDVAVGSLGVCDPCVSDSQCGDEGAPSDAYRCIPMTYPTEATRFPDASTGFCLKSTDGGCERPFSITLSDRSSLSGAPAADYCGINESLATCPAVRALEDDVRCEGGTDEECPESGICRQVGNLLNRCTYRCGFLVECLPSPLPGSTCGSSGSGGDDYCGG